MKEWISYLELEEDREVISNDHAFMAHQIHGKEMFVTELFVKEEYREQGYGLDVAERTLKRAIELGCECMTANVYIGKNNKDFFARKIACYTKFGFLPHKAENNTITLVKKL